MIPFDGKHVIETSCKCGEFMVFYSKVKEVVCPKCKAIIYFSEHTKNDKKKKRRRKA